MNDPHQTEQSAAGEPASEESSGQEGPSQDQGQQDQAPANSQDEVSEDIGNIQPGPPDQAQHAEAGGGEDESTEAQGTSAAPQKGKKALLLGLGSGALGLIVGLVLGAFAGPALLSGPGKPDGEAAKVVAALASKNPGQMGKVYCHGPNGKPVGQPLPAQALQLIQSVKRAGPLQRPLDTEAQVPLALTVSNQGRTQTLPANMVLGVTNGEWCMQGLAQPQQPQQ
jgi:hypothetical protein